MTVIIVAIIPRRLERERAFMVRMNAAGVVESNGFDELVIEENQKIVVHGLASIEAAPATETAYRENASRYRLTSGDGVISIDLA